MQFVRIERFGMIIIIFLLLTNLLDKLISFFLTPMFNILLENSEKQKQPSNNDPEFKKTDLGNRLLKLK